MLQQVVPIVTTEPWKGNLNPVGIHHFTLMFWHRGNMNLKKWSTRASPIFGLKGGLLYLNMLCQSDVMQIHSSSL